jgi:hypothetical protein
VKNFKSETSRLVSTENNNGKQEATTTKEAGPTHVVEKIENDPEMSIKIRVKRTPTPKRPKKIAEEAGTKVANLGLGKKCPVPGMKVASQIKVQRNVAPRAKKPAVKKTPALNQTASGEKSVEVLGEEPQQQVGDHTRRQEREQLQLPQQVPIS